MPLILPFYLEFSAISRAQSWAEAYPIQLTVVLRWGKEKKKIKDHGGFQSLTLIITELKRGFFLDKMKFLPMRDHGVLTGHVTFKLCYNQI